MKKRPVHTDFLKLYDTHADAIFRHCYFRVSEMRRAEDLTQETFMRAWDTVKRGVILKNPRAFLYRIANNLIIDYYRRRSRKEASLDEFLEKGVTVGGEDPQDADTVVATHELLKHLQKLDEDDRNIIIMRFINDHSPSEIAEALDISENAASVRVYRALQRLKKILSTQNYEF